MVQQKRKRLAERIVRLGRLTNRYEAAYFGAWVVAAGITLAVMLALE